MGNILKKNGNMEIDGDKYESNHYYTVKVFEYDWKSCKKQIKIF